MKKIKMKTDYLVVLKYLFLLCLFLVFNNLEKNIEPYSVSVYIAAISSACSPIVAGLFLILSFILIGETGKIAFVCTVILFFGALKIIYKKTNTKIGYSFVVFSS